MASKPLITLDQVSKRFYRTPADGLRNACLNGIRKLLRRPKPSALARGEFYALRDISLQINPGECLGIIGPNGAGKSTLLKLLNGDYHPDDGRIAKRGKVTSLLRLGSGLQPLLSGRENIYLHLTARGLDKPTIDRHLDAIIATAGLEKAVDTPVRHYSDGMYSRLEFAMTTALPLDILLIDEVLSVGDMAFQARSLERIRELKRQGTTVVMVSHSEMNIRWVADRCLLLFDGEMLGLGTTDALYRLYYQSVGFQQPLPAYDVLSRWAPADCGGPITLTGLRCTDTIDGMTVLQAGEEAMLDVAYQADTAQNELTLVLQFWSAREVLAATVDSGHHHPLFTLARGTGDIHVTLPFIGLMPGVYRVAAGFRRSDTWVSYNRDAMRLTLKPGTWRDDTGPLYLYAGFKMQIPS